MKKVARHLDAGAPRGATTAETGVVLLHHGGPGAPDAIEPFYAALLADPFVVKRKPLLGLRRAAAGPTDETLAALRTGHRFIGDRSPVTDLVATQALALENVLAGRPIMAARGPGAFVVTPAFRHAAPDAAAAIAELRAARVRRVVLAPMYAQRSAMLWDACVDAFEQAAREASLAAPRSVIAPLAGRDDFRRTMTARARAAFDLMPPDLRDAAHLVFAAHAPAPGRAEPAYLEQIEAEASAIMTALGRGEDTTAVGWQGFAGAGLALEPLARDLCIERATAGVPALVVVALSYLTDAYETLHDLDIELFTGARNAGAKQVRRAATPNADPAFVALLAAAVREAAGA